MELKGCTLSEIVVEPLLGTGLEDAMTSALAYAIEHDLNVTVHHKGRTFRITPRKILREIFDQQRENEQ